MNINHRQRQELMNENKYLCSYDKYKNKHMTPTQKYVYDSESVMPINTTFGTVEIFFSDILGVAHKFYDMQQYKPVVINMVDREFNGSNMDILSNITETDIMLRSNFYKTINGRNLYPLNDGEITYAESVLIFRNEKYQEINDIFETSMITFSPIKNPVLLGQYMLTNDYLGYQKSIEAIFQGAYIAGRDVIIFSDLGILSYGIPITELLEIVNICILKYCTLFKFIVFAISPKNQESKKIFDILSNSIVKPQQLNESAHNNIKEQQLNNYQLTNNPNMNNQMHQHQMHQNMYQHMNQQQIHN